MIGNLISAGTSLLGGLFGQNAADENRASQERQAELNRQMQIQFAKEGVRWKVEDAKQAGIHPLYALGANTTSYAPVSIGSSASSPMGSALASMGQDVGRAVNAGTTAPERMTRYQEMSQALQLDNMALQNQILASKSALLKQQQNPPIPMIGNATEVPVDTKLDPRNRVVLGGTEIRGHPGFSPAETITDEYGEPAEWAYAPIKMMADFYNHYINTHPDVAANRAVQSRYARARREGYPIGHRHWRE